VSDDDEELQVSPLRMREVLVRRGEGEAVGDGTKAGRGARFGARAGQEDR
jgi:hypothetical protein